MKSTELVAKLSQLASRAEPPPVAQLDRMIARALRAEPVPRRSRAWLFALGGAVAAAIAVLVLWPRTPNQTAVTKISLHHGEGVFAGEHVEIVTDQIAVTATNTVVSVDADHSIVRVYQGAVVVKQAGVAHTVIAGSAWAAGVGETRIAYAPQTIAIDPPPAVEVPPRPIIKPIRVAVERPNVAERAPTTRPSTPELLATARAEVAARKFSDALDAARSVSPWTGEWWLLVGDAHRGAGDTAAAADAYDRAAKLLSGADRSEAGYSAAYLRFRDLEEPNTALASLDAAGVDEAGSPLEERALGLRAQILVALHRDAKPTARRYLERFPHADLRSFMIDLTR